MVLTTKLREISRLLISCLELRSSRSLTYNARSTRVKLRAGPVNVAAVQLYPRIRTEDRLRALRVANEERLFSPCLLQHASWSRKEEAKPRRSQQHRDTTYTARANHGDRSTALTDARVFCIEWIYKSLISLLSGEIPPRARGSRRGGTIRETWQRSKTTTNLRRTKERERGSEREREREK